MFIVYFVYCTDKNHQYQHAKLLCRSCLPLLWNFIAKIFVVWNNHNEEGVNCGYVSVLRAIAYKYGESNDR